MWKRLILTTAHLRQFGSTSRVKYARSTRKGRSLNDDEQSFAAFTSPGDPLGFESAEDLEDLEDWAHIDNDNSIMDVLRKDYQGQRKSFYKTMERKHFKQPQLINLLTWNAKEQMRYLHDTYPDEWTVERLSESFPVDRESVLRILRSSFQPKNAEEILRHDRHVQKHWKILKSLESGRKIADVAVLDLAPYRELMDSDRIRLLSNACGIPSLPAPKPSRKLLKGNASGERSNRPQGPGLFQSIVHDYCERKKIEMTEFKNGNLKAIESREKMKDRKAENVKRLEHVTGSSKKSAARSGSYGNSAEILKQGKIGSDSYLIRSSFARKNSSRVNEFTSEPDPSFYYKDRNLYPPEDDYAVYAGKGKTAQNLDLLSASMERSSRKQSSERLQGRSLPELTTSASRQLVNFSQANCGVDKLGLRGTSKVSNSSDFDNNNETLYSDVENEAGGGDGHKHRNVVRQNSSNLRNDYDEASAVNLKKVLKTKYNVEQRTKEVLEQIQYGVPGSFSSREEEAYLFDAEKGYQYPYGRRDAAPDKIPVPEKERGRGQNAVYKRGDCFYDEDGEFLYKSP